MRPERDSPRVRETGEKNNTALAVFFLRPAATDEF